MFQFSGLSTLSHGLQPCGFPHSDIYGFNGRLHLPVAFRSLPRPSSSSRAKASPMRPYYASISLRLKYPIRSFLSLNYLAFLFLLFTTLLLLSSLVKDLSRNVNLNGRPLTRYVISTYIRTCLPASRFANNFGIEPNSFFNPPRILPLFFFGFHYLDSLLEFSSKLPF
jgi:hypothetical protein